MLDPVVIGVRRLVLLSFPPHWKFQFCFILSFDKFGSEFQMPFQGRRMDIFWNHTVHQLFNHLYTVEV